MSTNDVLITPGSGEVKWVDSGGNDFIRIIGDASLTNTITFVGDDNTANGVIFQDHATDVFYPATSGLNLGVSANRWNLLATAGDFSGAITTATNLTLSGANSTITINGASAAINMGGSGGLFTLSNGSSILLSGATSSITLSGLSSVLTLAGVTGTNLAPLKFTVGSAPGTSVAGQMWWTGSTNLQFAKTNGTASTFAFLDSDLSTFTTGILGVARGGTGTGTSFTTGSIVFAGASGIYTQDNANLFWDDTSNRLGIGTASPTSDLSLGGATTARTIALERKTSGAGSNLTIRSGGAQLGATDAAGGTLILSSGITTGQGFSYVDIYTYGDETVVTGSGDNGAVPVARFGVKGVALGTATIVSGLNLTLNSNAGVTPWTYVVGLPDSTATGGNSLTIKSGDATTSSNISGGTLALVAGNATGTGSSSITFSTATAGGAGAATRTSSIKMTLTGDGQLQVSTTGVSAGLLIGGDANLYRSAADTLKTDDSLIIAANLTVNSLTTTRVPFASTSGLLIDSANFTYTTGTGQLALATTGSGAGILIGGDTQLYRSAADTLRTPDSMTVDGTLTASGAVNITGGLLQSTYASFPQIQVSSTQHAAIYLDRGGTSYTTQFRFLSAGNQKWRFGCTSSGDDLIYSYYNGSSYIDALRLVHNTGQVLIPVQSVGAGLVIGIDTNLYRSAADTLKTDDAFVSGSTITGASSLTLGANGGTTGSILIRGTTSGTVTMTVAAVAGTWSFTLPTTAGSSGQYLQTDGAGVTSWQTLTGGLTWASNASSPVSAVASNGYIANLGTLLTYNLPTPAVGSIIEIVGLGAGGWKVQCASTHTIRMGTVVSAATGYAASTNQYDSVRIVGVSTTQWQITSAVGTIDLV